MTKSRTLRKAGAVVLSLAMAFSVAGVAPSADAAAKKPALSAKKGTITVGKTKAVKIQNTTKKKVKKLVVSSNKTAVATVKKNNKVKFTVTGKKAGTAKITAKVTLKKAVAKKKVYKLKYTATVKKAATPAPEATATPGELKLDKVESAGRIADNAATGALGGVNILVAYFTSAMSDIATSDIEIRRVSDNRLFTVEKVVMASDKKSATMTLTGTAAAAANTEYLRPNVAYKMIVKSGSKTLEKEFSVPAVSSEAIVTAVDKTAKTLSINNTAAKYQMGDVVTNDVEEILGRAVTFEYDRDNKITKFNLLDETVVYSSFEASAEDATTKAVTKIKDLKTKTEYSICAAAPSGASSIKATAEINQDKGALITAAKGNKIAYGKVTLNPDGTVRTIVSITDWTGNMYVGSTKDDYVLDVAGTSVNFKDFRVLKDGKASAVSEIKAGDVVYYDTDNKIADIYTADQVTGKWTVYDGKFEVNSTRYDFGTAKYVANKKVVNATTATTKADSGSDVVVFFDRAGSAAQIVLGTAAAATTSEFAVVVEDAKIYTSGETYQLTFTVNNGEKNEKITLDPTKLSKVAKKAGSAAAYEAGTTKFTATTTTNFAGTVKFGVNTVITVDANGTAGDGDLERGSLVKITKSADGATVTGLELATPGANEASDLALDTIADPFTTTPAEAAGSAIFKKGHSSIRAAGGGTGKLLSSSTPVYVWNGEAGDKASVKKLTYGEVDFTYTVSAGTTTVRFNGEKVDAIVINGKTAGITASDTDTKKVVIVDSLFDKDGAKLVELTVAYDGQKVTYKDLANDIAKAGRTWTPGTVVDIKVTKGDAPKLSDVALTAGVYTNVGGEAFGSQNPTTFALDGTYSFLNDGTKTTITTISADGKTVTALSDFSAYSALSANSVSSVKWYAYKSTNFIDTIVVTLASDTVKANLDAIDKTIKAINPTINATNKDKVDGMIVSVASDGTTVAWDEDSTPITPASGIGTTTATPNGTSLLTATVSKGGQSKAVAWALTKAGSANIVSMKKTDIAKYNAAKTDFASVVAPTYATTDNVAATAGAYVLTPTFTATTGWTYKFVSSKTNVVTVNEETAVVTYVADGTAATISGTAAKDDFVGELTITNPTISTEAGTNPSTKKFTAA